MEVIAGWFIMENLLKWMVYVDLIMLLHHFMASLNRKTEAMWFEGVPMFSQHFQRSPVFNDELLLGLVGVFGFAKPLRVARTKNARYRIRAFNIFNCSKKTIPFTGVGKCPNWTSPNYGDWISNKCFTWPRFPPVSVEVSSGFIISSA